MKILVCIKQILTSEICLDGSREWISKGGNPTFAINRFDENALEEALLLKEQIKERFGAESSVDVISAGGKNTAESIKRAMGMGADNGIHIITEDSGYVSATLTASRIATMINRNGEFPFSGYDLILTGIMSEDLMQAQVGPMVAEHLKIPSITSVVHTGVNGQMNQITVQRELEGGVRQNVKVKLPALLTIQAGINQPRYPSLSNILRANKREIISCRVKDLFPDETSTPDPLQLLKLEYPEKKREGRLLNGSTREKAAELMAILKHRGVI